MTKIGDFFEIEYGQKGLGLKSDLEEGKVPLISSGGLNNGVFGYFDLIPKYKNVISVPRVGTIGYAFYQGKDCCIDDNCLVLKPKKELSLGEIFYFVLLIRQNKYRFMYGRQITPKKLGEIIIPNKIPNFVYDSKIPDYSDIKESLNKEKLSLENKKFEYFEVKDLFELEKGKGPLVSEIEEIENGTNFITASEKNNGVSYTINYNPTHKGNTISIASNGSVGEAFYQEQAFCATGDLNVLIPKFELNKYIATFIITIIRKEKYRFSYGRKWGLEKMKTSKIKLPVDDSGNPDFQFMENYIKSLSYSKYL